MSTTAGSFERNKGDGEKASAMTCCVFTGKRGYGGYVGAQKALRRVRRQRKGKREVRAYRCRCGDWHLTSEGSKRWF